MNFALRHFAYKKSLIFFLINLNNLIYLNGSNKLIINFKEALKFSESFLFSNKSRIKKGYSISKITSLFFYITD
ncbi:hypothetical protein CW752_10800 [Chryseobacterium sp. PMSZPI]|nr:hypothetical protein CW752_10800 [Chryseobacterium sp. PMSZPI]